MRKSSTFFSLLEGITTTAISRPDHIEPLGVKNSATVRYCDELPKGSTAQCQQRMTLDLH